MTGEMQRLLLAVVLVLSAAQAWATPDVQEGTWEITTVTEMSGVAMQMPPQKHVQCLKQGDLVPQTPKTSRPAFSHSRASRATP